LRLAVLLLAGALALVLAPACATTPVARDPAPLEISGDLGRSFFVRQRIHARFEGPEPGERRFETALQSRCGELRLVALSPFGLRLFSAVSRGGEIRVESLGGRPLPFAPEHVVRDIERTFFRSPPVAPGASETRSLVRAGEQVVETWRDGVLVSREVRPAGAPESAKVVIRYEGPPQALGISPSVSLSNPAFRYDLSIENYAVEELECPSAEP